MDSPLTKAELKTVTLLLRNARDPCEVIEYIGELKLLEAASLGKHLSAVKEWLPRIEELAEWRGELDVDLELFAADLELVHGACELRLKLELEEYRSWFGKSAFHTMPRFMGRLSRLCASLARLKRYTREAYDDMPDPTPPLSPALSIHGAAVVEDETMASGDAAPDATTSSLPRTSSMEQESPPATVALEEAEIDTEEAGTLLYLPELDVNGYRVLPDGMFSDIDVSNLERAKSELAQGVLYAKQGRRIAVAYLTERARNIIEEVYHRSAPLARAHLADMHASCLSKGAMAEGDPTYAQIRAVSEAQIILFRDAHNCCPNDVLVQEQLGDALVNLLSATPAFNFVEHKEDASLAVRLLKNVRTFFDGRTSIGTVPSVDTVPTGWRTCQLLKALLYLGMIVRHEDGESAVAAWKEGVGYLAAADELSGLDSNQMLVGIELHTQLATLYGESREWTLGLQRARRGLELCKRQVMLEGPTEFLRQQTTTLRTICWRLLPEEEKRLIKVVNIRKLQTKTRRIGGKKDSDAEKALMATAVAALVDLRAIEKALREGTL